MKRINKSKIPLRGLLNAGYKCAAPKNDLVWRRITSAAGRARKLNYESKITIGLSVYHKSLVLRIAENNVVHVQDVQSG